MAFLSNDSWGRLPVNSPPQHTDTVRVNLHVTVIAFLFPPVDPPFLICRSSVTSVSCLLRSNLQPVYGSVDSPVVFELVPILYISRGVVFRGNQGTSCAPRIHFFRHFGLLGVLPPSVKRTPAPSLLPGNGPVGSFLMWERRDGPLPVDFSSAGRACCVISQGHETGFGDCLVSLLPSSPLFEPIPMVPHQEHAPDLMYFSLYQLFMRIPWTGYYLSPCIFLYLVISPSFLLDSNAFHFTSSSSSE